MTKPDTTPKLAALIQAEPDLVDRIFDYIMAELPEIAASVQKHKDAVRAEFGGQRHYIATRPPTVRRQTVANIRAQFNGVNIKDVATATGVSRRTVYRAIQPSQK